MKFAYLVCFELRSLKHIKKLYKHIVDYYDADIFICVQDAPDIQDKIKLFDRKVKKIKIIKKVKDAKINYFQNEKLDTFGGGNFKKDPMLNFYINLIEMGKFIKDEIKNYDYFILLRTDIDILFNFPPKKIFKSLSPSIFKFDPDYTKKYGGWGSNTFTHKNYIYESLTCFDKIFRNNNLIKKYYDKENFRVPNQETFSNYCYKLCNFKFKNINDINFWFSVDITTKEEMIESNQQNLSRTPLQWFKEKKMVCKYMKQVKEVFKNLEMIKNNYTWSLDKHNNILLVKTF